MCILVPREAGAQALRTPATSQAFGESLGKTAKTTELLVLPLLALFGRFLVELGGESFADAMAVATRRPVGNRMLWCCYDKTGPIGRVPRAPRDAGGFHGSKRGR
jgi:hypothetical protein